MVAALLTLVGYSMNDTIVVFDRIRENLKLMRRETLGNADEHEHQPDAEPDHPDLGPDVPDGVVAVSVRRSGAERFFFCAGGWYYRRDLFVGFHRQSDCGVLAEFCRKAEKATGDRPWPPAPFADASEVRQVGNAARGVVET